MLLAEISLQNDISVDVQLLMKFSRYFQCYVAFAFEIFADTALRNSPIFPIYFLRYVNSNGN